jgi:hypothetical protein
MFKILVVKKHDHMLYRIVYQDGKPKISLPNLEVISSWCPQIITGGDSSVIYLRGDDSNLDHTPDRIYRSERAVSKLNEINEILKHYVSI